MTFLRKMKSTLLRFKVSFWVTQGYKTQKTTIIFYMLAFKIFLACLNHTTAVLSVKLIQILGVGSFLLKSGVK